MMNIISVIDPVIFTEEVFVKSCIITDKIVKITSNFGSITSDAYIDPKDRVKSNRGRKPKIIPNPKSRKQQGNGKEFGSQVTLTTLLGHSKKPLKIKVFRQGTLQIPGITDEHLEHLDEYCDTVLCYLEMILGVKKINIYHNYIVLENYKFIIDDVDLITKNKILDLEHVFNEFKEYMVTHKHIPIKFIKYDDNDAYLQIIFQIDGRKSSVFIYTGGKINIRGGLYTSVTEIYGYIGEVIDRYYWDDWVCTK